MAMRTIHDEVDVAHWRTIFPIDRLRGDAKERALAFREQYPERWLDRALFSHASTWWLANRRGMLPIDLAEAKAAVARERDHDPDTWDAAHLAQEVLLSQPNVNAITSPVHLAIFEQLREEMRAGLTLDDGVPVDLFVWNIGEPPRREMTKIGGLPYW